MRALTATCERGVMERVCVRNKHDTYPLYYPKYMNRAFMKKPVFRRIKYANQRSRPCTKQISDKMRWRRGNHT